MKNYLTKYGQTLTLYCVAKLIGVDLELPVNSEITKNWKEIRYTCI